MEEAADYYKAQTELLCTAVRELDEESWDNKEIALVINGHRIHPASVQFWFWRMLNDTIHHRGQLSTYYRSMGVRNPSIYGPAAEDREEMAAKAAAAATAAN